MRSCWLLASGGSSPPRRPRRTGRFLVGKPCRIAVAGRLRVPMIDGFYGPSEVTNDLTKIHDREARRSLGLVCSTRGLRGGLGQGEGRPNPSVLPVHLRPRGPAGVNLSETMQRRCCSALLAGPAWKDRLAGIEIQHRAWPRGDNRLVTARPDVSARAYGARRVSSREGAWTIPPSMVSRP
jgi:hypothetical protein